MERSSGVRQRVVAGTVRAACGCCAVRQELVTHPDLDEAHRVCPVTGRGYLDRGDGVFEPDGQIVGRDELVATAPAPVVSAPVTVARASSVEELPEILSDRPKRTGPKTRIELERATFASGRPGSGGRPCRAS